MLIVSCLQLILPPNVERKQRASALPSATMIGPVAEPDVPDFAHNANPGPARRRATPPTGIGHQVPSSSAPA